MSFNNMNDDISWEAFVASVKASKNHRPPFDEIEKLSWLSYEEVLGTLATIHPELYRTLRIAIDPVRPSNATLNALKKYSVQGISLVLSQLTSEVAVKKLTPFNVCAAMDAEGYNCSVNKIEKTDDLEVVFTKHNTEYRCAVKNGLIDPAGIDVRGLKPLLFNPVTAQVCKALTSLFSLRNGKFVVVNASQADAKLLGRSSMSPNYVQQLENLCGYLSGMFDEYVRTHIGKSMHGPTLAHFFYVSLMTMLTNGERKGKDDYVNLCRYVFSPKIFGATMSRGENGERLNTRGLWEGSLQEWQSSQGPKLTLTQSFRSIPLKVPNEIQGVSVALCDPTRKTYVLEDAEEIQYAVSLLPEKDKNAAPPKSLSVVCNSAHASLISAYRALVLSRTARGENKGEKGAGARMFYNAVYTTASMAEVSYMLDNIKLYTSGKIDDIMICAAGDVLLRVLKALRVTDFRGTVHFSQSDSVAMYLVKDFQQQVRFSDGLYNIVVYPADMAMYPAMVKKFANDASRLCILDLLPHGAALADLSKFTTWEGQIEESLRSRFCSQEHFVSRQARYVTFGPLLQQTGSICKSLGINCYSRVDCHNLIVVYTNFKLFHWWTHCKYNLCQSMELDNYCAMTIFINILRCNEALYDFDLHNIIIKMGYRFNRAGLKDLSVLKSRNVHFDDVNVDEYLRQYMSGAIDLDSLPASVAAAFARKTFEDIAQVEGDVEDVDVFGDIGQPVNEAKNVLSF
jgi:hypothetical protein